MKKTLLLFVLVFISGTIFSQDTITGWNFAANSGSDSLNANLGTTQNQGYDLRLQMTLTPTSDSTINTIYFTDGATSFAAATANWDNGSDSKFWSVKFKAADYSSFKVSSKQKSDAVNPGPKDFKLQWRTSSTEYQDVTGGSIVVANDWTTGVLNNLPVPITEQGTSSCYIRWIMTSNEDINGGTVATTGISAIDDILVTATKTLGVEEVIYTNRLNIYPNPSTGNFTVSSTQPLELISIIDASGRIVRTVTDPKANVSISLETKGTYIVRGKFRDNPAFFTNKLIVE